MPASPPRSAYIHVPFCVHRCGYCNFALVADRGDLVEPYLQALATELSWLGEPRPVDTLYFGGGTPTFLSPEQLDKLCRLATDWHPLRPGYEWTVEANPGDLDRDRVGVLVDRGVNRLSLGAQSFRDEKLRLLERDHQADDVGRAVELARRAGLSVAIDLIFAAPGETLDQWHDDLRQALALLPEHISTYGLTFERGTTFWNRQQRGDLTSMTEDEELEMYELAIDLLSNSGFEHYEISNFALPGCRSRHNTAYWSGAGYYAVGPGAASYVDGVRETNHRSTTTYLKRIEAGESPVAESERLDAQQRAREQLVFGLRQLAGVDRYEFARRTGFELDKLAGTQIARLVELGMLAADDSHVRLTRSGLMISDSIWPELL